MNPLTPEKARLIYFGFYRFFRSIRELASQFKTSELQVKKIVTRESYARALSRYLSDMALVEIRGAVF